MKNNTWFPVVYMFIVTAVFSSILLGLSDYTHDKIESNARLAFEVAALEALDLTGDMNKVEIHDFFTANLIEKDGYYVYSTDNKVQAYAVPIDGKGFWNEIKGIVGVKPDKRTIIKVSFYEQSETPGLGAEIVKPFFRNQFEKKTLAADKAMPLEIKPFGVETNNSEISAITGATQTCTRLNKFMNEDLSKWIEKVESEDTK